MTAIAHVIPHFASSGPVRALVTFASVARELGLGQTHTVWALEEAASPIALLQARHAGIAVHRRPDRDALHRGLEAADVVVVHFWNHPALARFLRSALPPARLVVWSTVLGARPPQVITPALARFADRLVVKNPRSLEVAAVADARPPARLVLSPIDVTRLAGVRRRRHATFTVGYIGTINFAKMHPEFVAMHAAARIPDLKVLVCGGGGAEGELAAQARRLGCAERFELLGYVEQVGDVLSRLDVLGYPLCEDTYATSERSLQEAMWCGVPPVLLPHGGVPALVRPGVNAVVAAGATDYPRALERLYHDRRELRRLGRNARAHARRTFEPRRAVREMAALLAELCREPKRGRHWPTRPASAAELFVESLGEHGTAFAASLRAATAVDASAADAVVARASTGLAAGEGGVFHYRNSDPGDAHLRLWSGLILTAAGDAERAREELAAARRLGIGARRLPPVERAAGGDRE